MVADVVAGVVAEDLSRSASPSRLRERWEQAFAWFPELPAKRLDLCH